MSAHQLVSDLPGNVVDVEAGPVGPLSGDPRVEQNLKQHVAKLTAELGEVVPLDRLERFVCLLEQIWRERLVRLPGVPRALAPKPVHDRDQLD